MRAVLLQVLSRSVPWVRAAATHRQRRAFDHVRQMHMTQGELKAMLPTMQELGLRASDSVEVAVSGGVDSSVTLKILSEMPIRLRAVFMRNWDPLLSEEQDIDRLGGDTVGGKGGVALKYGRGTAAAGPSGQHQCEWERDWNDVLRVTKHIGLGEKDVRLVDFTKDYWSRVFEPAVGVWQNGGTPNPDISCNREIKFGSLLRSVEEPHFLATGHYARIKRDTNTNDIKLCRAIDADKDQTYYLSQLSEADLRRTIFPLANIPKPKVRALAQHWKLPTADREESMGVCFIGERGKFGNFISQYTNPSAIQGYLVGQDGSRLASHDGLWHYTIGQGARLAGLSEKWFVARKGVGKTGQDILVVPGSDHPALLCTRVYTDDFHWIHGSSPVGGDEEPREADIQIRHRMKTVKGRISKPSTGRTGQGLQVDFVEPLTGVSPGQVLAVYQGGDWCLGSGTILETRCLDQEFLEERPEHAVTAADVSRPDMAKESDRAVRLDAGSPP